MVTSAENLQTSVKVRNILTLWNYTSFRISTIPTRFNPVSVLTPQFAWRFHGAEKTHGIIEKSCCAEKPLSLCAEDAPLWFSVRYLHARTRRVI
jgi:hypothetical protein